MIVFYSILAIGVIVLIPSVKKSLRKVKPVEIPLKWHPILMEKVRFYRELNVEERQDFLEQSARFLRNIKIVGVSVDVSLEDRLLIAASAVIPLFGFRGWEYVHLDEVILYPSHFDEQFNFKDPKEMIIGMVGSGIMEGKMILSQPDLHIGFDNTQDKLNVGIHEFLHLYDKEDGVIDGVPAAFIGKHMIMPWIDLVRIEMSKIHEGDSALRSYGGYNGKEFFAVAGEYFFERPHLLQKDHPELYDMLSRVFNREMTDHLTIKELKSEGPGRNSPCPCGSGMKYKRCCLVD